jgi:proteasome lid subunit RPN8/RPN11
MASELATLRMTQAVFDRIRAHAEQAYPHECCGVLLGRADRRPGRVEAAMPAENASPQSTRSHYEISPLELVRIDKEARRRSLEIIGFYHSHPDHPANWSPTDFDEAHWLGCSYLITAVARGKAAVTNAFQLIGESEDTKLFQPQSILISDDGA